MRERHKSLQRRMGFHSHLKCLGWMSVLVKCSFEIGELGKLVLQRLLTLIHIVVKTSTVSGHKDVGQQELPRKVLYVKSLVECRLNQDRSLRLQCAYEYFDNVACLFGKSSETHCFPCCYVIVIDLPSLLYRLDL